jgi:hypothetical protein
MTYARGAKVSTQFRFKIDPGELAEEREARWDSSLAELQAAGLTVAGVGPDGDWPIGIEYPDGHTISFTSEPLDGPIVEVYDTRKLNVARAGKAVDLPADVRESMESFGVLDNYAADQWGRANA